MIRNVRITIPTTMVINTPTRVKLFMLSSSTGGFSVELVSGILLKVVVEGVDIFSVCVCVSDT